MTTRIVLILAIATLSVTIVPQASAAGGDDGLTLASTDWAWWRGPHRNGIAEANQTPPLEWSAEKNILWKTPVPGRGFGSPTVVGDRIFLPTADEKAEVQSVICYDRKTGEQRWKTDVHKGGFTTTGRQGHVRSTKASTTVACDGERAFVAFINTDAIFLTALDLDGKQIWQKKVCDFVVHQGYGASPSIYGPLVIVAADHKGGGTIAAFDRVTGEVVWSQKRPQLPNYTSPAILNVAGHDQLLIFGCDLISSYDPLTGKPNWEVAGSTTECVTTLVADDQYVVTSGGYPTKHISVVKGDGSGEVRWQNNTQIYVPSMIVHEGFLYAVSDSGTALCYNMENGNLAWEHRLGGSFAASPVLVGDQIFATNDNGTTFIFKANPAAFEQVGENVLPSEEVQATPVYCGDHIFMRITVGKDEQRQEMLYCIGT